MSKKLAPLTGVLFFLVLLVSVLGGGNSLTAKSSPAKVLAYYTKHKTNTEFIGILTVLSVFIGVIFYGQLRDYLRRHDGSRGLTATAFGGVLLFAASGGVSAGVDFALSDSPKHLTPAAAQVFNLMEMDVSGGLSLAGIALLLFCFGWAILNTGLLPKWLGWVAFPLTLVALVPPLGFIAFIGVGLWTLIVSIAMWRRLASDDRTAAAALPAS
ncbi:MAG TPA: hypothetical protein VKR23_02220 [Gaiellaceae bacterium]|nr:hypothetical protein [Gaiellaceae bacterium]